MVPLTHVFLGHLTTFGWSGDLKNLALNHLTKFGIFIDRHTDGTKKKGQHFDITFNMHNIRFCRLIAIGKRKKKKNGCNNNVINLQLS